MTADESEHLPKQIGQLPTEDREYSFEPTLLYAQLDRNMVGESIFKELGNQILYRRPVIEGLPYALLDLWEAQERDDRWMEISSNVAIVQLCPCETPLSARQIAPPAKDMARSHVQPAHDVQIERRASVGELS